MIPGRRDDMGRPRRSDCATLLSQVQQSLEAVPPMDCPEIIGTLEKLKTLALRRMLNPDTPIEKPVTPTASDKYLTVDEAAARFKVTKRFLYKHKKRLPHSQPSRKILLFPEQAITRWFASRKAS